MKVALAWAVRQERVQGRRVVVVGSRDEFAVISAPLSMCSGMPLASITSAIVSMIAEAVDLASYPDRLAFPGELVD
jgi:hypothetical protein